MIDVENEIIHTLKQAILELEPTALVVGDYVDSPTSYPVVTIMELDNNVYDSLTGGVESHSTLAYEINVYTNDSTGRKARNKKINLTIAQQMERLGFERTSLNPVANYLNPSIYRMVSRYRAVIDRNHITYRR